MKILYTTLVLLVLFACKQSSETTDAVDINMMKSSESASPEDINTIVPDEEDGGEMLLGKIDFNGLQQEPFKEWFNRNEAEYVLDSTFVDSISPLLKNISIKVFMGTWCEDSQRELPALYKILKAANYKMRDLEMIAVTHEKDTPQGFEKDYELRYVPSIIFYKDGAEINRIVEYTQESLEKDMMKILSGRPYKNAYAE